MATTTPQISKAAQTSETVAAAIGPHRVYMFYLSGLAPHFVTAFSRGTLKHKIGYNSPEPSFESRLCIASIDEFGEVSNCYQVTQQVPDIAL